MGIFQGTQCQLSQGNPHHLRPDFGGGVPFRFLRERARGELDAGAKFQDFNEHKEGVSFLAGDILDDLKSSYHCLVGGFICTKKLI